jgi:hypothetical protein
LEVQIRAASQSGLSASLMKLPKMPAFARVFSGERTPFSRERDPEIDRLLVARPVEGEFPDYRGLCRIRMRSNRLLSLSSSQAPSNPRKSELFAAQFESAFDVRLSSSEPMTLTIENMNEHPA